MDVYAESLESLLASLRQHGANAPLTPMPALAALNRGDVIEIQGRASSGKTHLLYHIVSSVLVPVARSQRAEIAAAVVYDTDAAFDVARLRHLLLSRIARLDPNESVQRALARLHVFRPTSLAQLAASIATLPAYHSSHMPNQEIALLAIDSISAFYWANRFSAEPSQVHRAVPMAPSLYHVLHAIQTVRYSHRPLAVMTNWALNSHPESLYKQHLHPFPLIDTEDDIQDLGAKALRNIDHCPSSPFRLTHHITLSSPPLDDHPFLRDARLSKEIADNDHVHCFTRVSGTRETVQFTLQITHDDVLVIPF